MPHPARTPANYRIPATPGLLRSTSLNRPTPDVRVTARPSGIGAFTAGNVNATGTAPTIRYPEGPRSRSGAFHSLPSRVRYTATSSGTPTRQASVSPLRRKPPAETRLRRGWVGRAA